MSATKRCPVYTIVFVTILPLFLAVFSCSESETIPALTITTPAFIDGGVLPTRHTCYGEGESPLLYISDAPPETLQFALLLENLDYTGRVQYHWLIWGIPPSGYVPGNIREYKITSKDICQGHNNAGFSGYSPPCPSRDEQHRYQFTVYALNTSDVPAKGPNTLPTDLMEHIENHIIAKGHIIAVYF